MTPLPAATAHYPLLTERSARRERFKGLNHLVPAVVLVQGATDAITHHDVNWARGLELALGMVFVVLLVRHWYAVRHRPTGPAPPHRPEPHGPEWLELAAGGILAMEGYHLWLRPALVAATHKFHVLPWLYGAVAIWYVLMAFHRARPSSRRSLCITPAGFWLRRSVLGRAHRVPWAGLRALAPVGEGPDLLLYPLDGGQPQPLALHQYLNGSWLSEQLLAHAVSYGLALNAPDQAATPTP